MDRRIRTYPAVLGMDSITLEEMESVKLMNRIDSKYVTTDDKLDLLLERAAREGYRACIIAAPATKGSRPQLRSLSTSKGTL